MHRTGFHKKVIVCLNCAQSVMTVVGSEVRVLPILRVGPIPALMLQRLHSCHHLIVLPITRNYSWQRQCHSAALTKGITFLSVWSRELRMLPERKHIQMICFLNVSVINWNKKLSLLNLLCCDAILDDILLAQPMQLLFFTWQNIVKRGMHANTKPKALSVRPFTHYSCFFTDSWSVVSHTDWHVCI